MLSFRERRNTGLFFILLLLIFIISFYLFSQHKMQAGHQHIGEHFIELARWFRVIELAADVKSGFYRIYAKKEELISPVLFGVKQLEDELAVIYDSAGSEYEKEKIEDILSSARGFRSALSAYRLETEEGYFGASAFEIEKLALLQADKIESSSYTAIGEINAYLSEQNLEVINELSRLNFIFIPSLLICVFLILFIWFYITSFLSRWLKKIGDAMNKVSHGERGFRLSGLGDDELGRLIVSFNKMADELLCSHNEANSINQILDKVTANINEGLLLLDPDLNIRWANKNILEISGLKHDEIIGRFCYQVLHFQDTPCASDDNPCGIKDAVEKKQPVTDLHLHKGKEGKDAFVEVTIIPLFDKDGRIFEFIHVSRDVTQRMVLENKLKDNVAGLERAKGELSHKLAELEKFNAYAVDRELRMRELKEKLKQFEKIAGNNENE